jgi:alpha-L-arabinofuranosidase
MLFVLTQSLAAATAINVTTNVTVANTKRFGISGISHYYYDRVLLKNLVWFNAGFEGLRWRTMIRCDHGSATTCVDDLLSDQWPDGFWNGGTYEFVLGTTKGRSGTITAFTTAPRDNVNGNTFTFGDSGATPAQGDYFIAEKYFPGGAETGWSDSLVALNGATVSTESSDLAPDTPGRQCIRLSASGQGQTLQIATPFGFFRDSNFVIMNGTYRITFKAKGVGGTNAVRVRVARGTNPSFVDQSVALSASWSTYTVDFSAAEPVNIAPAMVNLSFNASGSSVLLDDVSLVQTNGDPTNTTSFRDAVLNVFRDFHPGSLRAHVLDQGDCLDDLIAPPLAHRRNEYTPYANSKRTTPYGWHEFLELCEAAGAEPYISIPLPFNDREAANLIEYLAGPETSTYGARRAARGHPAPWTSSFTRINLEFGNEAWNPVFRGATMFAADYGHRGNDFFAIMRASPYFDPAKFNLILGVQAVNPFNARTTHNASATHDAIAIAPYMATRIDDYTSNEQLFGGLFAESSWWSTPAVGGNAAGPVRQMYDFINGTSRPVPIMVYEDNMNTTQGSIPQSLIDGFVASTGAGLAVADQMLIMLRDEKVRDQDIFSLAGYRLDFNDGTGRTAPLWAITRDVGVTDRKRPQYFAAKLINEVIGGDLIETQQTGDNPKWNQPLTNRIRLDNVSYVQSFAFVNGTHRGIILFNLHRSSALDVTVGGANAPAGTVTMKQLTSANITDTNETSNTVAVTTQTLANFDGSTTLTLPPFSMTVLSSDGTPPMAMRSRGDVNGNGSVTAFDASLVLQDVVGAASLDTSSQCAADYNANGSVTAFDASLILQCVVGGACSSATCN